MESNPSATQELREAIRTQNHALARKAISEGADLGSKFEGISYTPVGWATYWGLADIVETLVSAGAPVPTNELEPLGKMDITDWLIDPAEREPIYARVAEMLVSHGASPCVTAFNGKPLIENFPEQYYPNIHRVLSDALVRSKVTQ